MHDPHAAQALSLYPHLYGTCFAEWSVSAATTSARAERELLMDVSSLTLHRTHAAVTTP